MLLAKMSPFQVRGTSQHPRHPAFWAGPTELPIGATSILTGVCGPWMGRCRHAEGAGPGSGTWDRCTLDFTVPDLARPLERHKTQSGSPTHTPGRAWSAPEPKDALDVAGEAALGLLLQLVVEGGEGHVVERQVEEERLAGHRLEARREVHQAGLLGHQRRVQAEGLKPLDQRLWMRQRGCSGTSMGRTS